MVNTIFFSLVVCLASYGSAAGNSYGTGWHLQQGKISARLTHASLPVLVQQMEVQAGVWFKVETDLAGKTISVRFTDIPLEEGLKRILRGMNHCLVYSADGSVAGVIVLGRGKNPAQSDPVEVRVNRPEPRPVATAPNPDETNVSSKNSSLRLAKPSTLPRAASHVRAETPHLSLNLKNRGSAP
jgi:hypothetical protein